MSYKLRFFADFCLALTASQTLIRGSLVLSDEAGRKQQMLRQSTKPGGPHVNRPLARLDNAVARSGAILPFLHKALV